MPAFRQPGPINAILEARDPRGLRRRQVLGRPAAPADVRKNSGDSPLTQEEDTAARGLARATLELFGLADLLDTADGRQCLEFLRRGAWVGGAIQSVRAIVPRHGELVRTLRIERLVRAVLKILETGGRNAFFTAHGGRVLTQIQRVLNHIDRADLPEEFARYLEQIEEAIEPHVAVPVRDVNPRFVRNMLLRARFGRFKNARPAVRRNFDVVAQFVLRHGIDASRQKIGRLEKIGRELFGTELSRRGAYQIVELRVGDRVWEYAQRSEAAMHNAGNALDIGEWFLIGSHSPDPTGQLPPVGRNHVLRELELTTNTPVLRSMVEATDDWWGKASGTFRSNGELFNEEFKPLTDGRGDGNQYWLPDAKRFLRFR